MALNSIVLKKGDGTTTDFTFSFTGGYMSQADVFVRVGNEVDGTGAPLHRSITFVNAGTVTVGGSVPALDEDVKIYRITPIQTAVNDFRNGTVLDAETLDRGYEQLIKAAQELNDALQSADNAYKSAYEALASAVAAKASEVQAAADLALSEEYRDTTKDHLDAVNIILTEVETLRDQAQTAKTAAEAANASSQAAATATSNDATAVAAHALQTAADRVQTTSDAADTASDLLVTFDHKVAAEAAAKSAVGALNGVFDEDAQAIIGQIEATITAGQANVIHSTVTRLKQKGIWNVLDVFGIDTGISEQAALLNWVNPSQPFKNNGTSYVQGQGFVGNLGSQAWIDTNVDPSPSTRWQQDSAHMSVFVNGVYAATNERELGMSGNNPNTFMTVYSVSSALQARLNCVQAANNVLPTAFGLSGADRRSSSSMDLYKDGALIDTESKVSSDTTDGNFAVLRSASSYSAKRVQAWSFGASLTPTQWSDLNAVITDARQGIVIVPAQVLLDYKTRTKAQAVTPASGVLTVDYSKGAYALTTLTADVTSVVLQGVPSDVSQVHFLFTQDATGGHTVTFPTAWLTPGGGPAPSPATTAGTLTHVVASTFDGGTTFALSQGETWQ